MGARSAILRRRDRLARNASVAATLFLSTASLGLAGCGTASGGRNTDSSSPRDAGAEGTIGASDGPSTTDVTLESGGPSPGDATVESGRPVPPDATVESDGPSTIDGSDDGTQTSVDAAAAEEAGSEDDAATIDAGSVDAAAALGVGAQPIEAGGGGTLCGASCGPGQMSCTSPLVEYQFLQQGGFNFCFPESDAGCAGLMASNAGACDPFGYCPSTEDGGCGPSLTQCGDCVDTTSNPRSCGSCSNSCGPALSGTAACIDSTCVMTCVAGWTLCGNQCSVTTSDAANCGACGHACAAGQICTASACVAQSAVWLVTGLASPSEINVDQNNVYWSDSILNSISGVPKNGGSTFAVARPQSIAIASLPFDDTYIYYWQGATLMRARKDGTASPQVVTTTSAQGVALGVDSTSLYFMVPPFTEMLNPSAVEGQVNSTPILRVPKGGGTPTVYVTPNLLGPLANAVSDNLAMYVLSPLEGPRSGCGFAGYGFAGTDGGALSAGYDLICSGLLAGPMAVDATNVYTWGSGGIVAYSKDDGVFGLVPGVASPYAGASCGVVWAGSGGIYWTSITTSATATSGITPGPGPGPGAFVGQLIAPGVGPVANLIADDDNIYWTDSGHGAIGRLRLP